MSNSNAVRILIALLVMLCITAYPAGGKEEVPPTGGTGSIERVKGISVVSLSGTPRELGYMHGRLLGDRLLETEAAFKKLMPAIPGGFIGEWLVRTFVMFQLDGVEEHLTGQELEEMKGMAQAGPDGSRDYRELLYYHVLQDIGQNYACTGGAACGGSSALKGPVAGRNFDMNSGGVLDPLKTVFYYEPDDGPAYATVAWPGMVGAVTGMNDRGLCVMIFSARSEGTSLSGVPVAFLARRILAGAGDVDEAVEILEDTPRMGPNTFLIVDTKHAAAVEFDSEKLAVRTVEDGVLPVANHFLTDAFADDGKNACQARYSDSRQRLARAGELLGHEIPVGVKEMAAVLRDHSGPDGITMAWSDPAAINNVKDAHSVIFDPAGLRFWVSTPPSAYGEFVGFRLTGSELARIHDLPASGYPYSDAGVMARYSHELLDKAVMHSDEGMDMEAMEEAWTAMGVDPSNYRAAMLYGELCMDEYNYSEAFDAFDSAVMHAPDCYPAMADALAGRGMAARKLGLHDQANSDFSEVLDMDCSEEAVHKALRGLEYM